MLYICPECGNWLYSLGIAEAFALATGANYSHTCAGCKIQMQAYSAEEQIKIIPKRARQAPQTPQYANKRAPQMVSYDREKNKRRKH